ncbi:MAG: GIY-YIG nuclease family protein [Clostridia bacterium]|jgi:group I intron endonuclease
MEEKSLVLVYGIIYKCTNLINNKVYIGQTIKGLECRKKKHESSKNNQPIVLAITKYGKENFKWEIIDRAFSRSELNYKEIFYIKLFHSLAKFGAGYNIASGGSNGSPWEGKNEEEKELYRKKISNTIRESGICRGKNNPRYGKGENIVGCKNPMYGRKHKRDSNIKNSLSNQNKIWVNNKIMNQRISRAEEAAYLKLGWFRGQIKRNKVQPGPNHFNRGKKWSEETRLKISIIRKLKYNKTSSRKIYQYDIDFNLVKIYDRLKDVEFFDFCQRTVAISCKKLDKIYKNFYWRYSPIGEENLEDEA